MKFLKVLFLLLFIASCSPEQRIARILLKNPHLVKKDTIFRTDTIITKEIKTDTSFYYAPSDTVTITKDRLQIKYVFNRKDSTIFIQGKCKSDTIYKTYPVYINNISIAKALTLKERVKLWLFSNSWWIIAIIALIIFGFRNIIKAWFSIK